MKKILTTSLFLVAATIIMAGKHIYADRSVLADGNSIKIRVDSTGIYCLTYSELQEMGLRPEQVRVLGFGGAMLSENFSLDRIDDLPSNAFYMHTGNDGVFGQGDYILFYAIASLDWKYSGNTYSHTRNPYSNYGYYFLSDNIGEQILISTAPDSTNHDIALPVNRYTACQLHEEERINLIDPIYGKSGGGREWYGEQLNTEKNTLNIPFHFDNIDTSAVLTCRVEVAAKSSENSIFTGTIGSTSRMTMCSGIPTSNFHDYAYIASLRILNAYPKNNTPNLNLNFTNTSSASTGYLNYVEMLATCHLRMSGNAIYIRNTDNIGSIAPSCYQLAETDAETQVWNFTDPQHIYRMTTYPSGDTLRFYAENSQIQQFIAIRPSDSKGWRKPHVVGKVPSQNLHGIQQADLIIVTNPQFYNASLRLAEAHTQYDDMTCAVVTDEQVFNEFSSGTPDASAIRWFAKMLYDRNVESGKQPKNILLMGDGSFDNRKILSTSAPAYILTYQAVNSTNEVNAYTSDDYYAFLEDKDGVSGSEFSAPRARLRCGIGRLPVRNAQQAEDMVDKCIEYISNCSYGKWKQQICVLADDDDHGLHTRTAEKAGELLRSSEPNFIVNKIYLDAYTQESTASGESYPVAYNQFTNLLHNGVLYMNYSGHGSANNICNELFLTLKDVETMTNRNLGFWLLATCNYAKYDQTETSSAEEAVLNPHGGAIGVFSASRTVYADQNGDLSQTVTDTLFGHATDNAYLMTLGEATAIGKNMTGNDANKMAYVLLGDPAIRLHFPTDASVISTSPADTLHALSKQTIEGYIRAAEPDEQGNDTATWFNGKLHVSIYDKVQTLTTRDNDEPVIKDKRTMDYLDYPNRLFSGETDVVDGKFSYTFMLPKDIRYNYGNGRIVYYAYDEQNAVEAVGHDHRFIIGGSSPLEIQDTIGPELTIYLNNPEFQDGGKTHERPHFYATIADEHGINTVGSGIGHDLMLVVDNDVKQAYILNDYFVATNNSYQMGTISYRFSELKEGPHALTFRAWDLLNNSASASLRFEVVKNLNPILFSVLTYPNPLPRYETLNIHLNFDQPDEIIKTELFISDISGKMIYHEQHTTDDDFQINLGQIGMPAGIYIYKLHIQTSTGATSSSKSGKLIVL